MSKFKISAYEIKTLLQMYGFTYFNINGKNIFEVDDNAIFYDIPKEFLNNDLFVLACSCYNTGSLSLFAKNGQKILDSKTTESLFNNKNLPRSSYNDINIVDDVPIYISPDEEELINMYLNEGKYNKIDKKYWTFNFVYNLVELGYDLKLIFNVLLQKNISLAHHLYLNTPSLAEYLYKDMPDYLLFLKEIPEKNREEAAYYISDTEVAKDFINLYPDNIADLDPDVLDTELLIRVIESKMYWYLAGINYSILPKELLMNLLNTNEDVLDILYYIREEYPDYNSIVLDTFSKHMELQNLETITSYFSEKEVYIELINNYKNKILKK